MRRAVTLILVLALVFAMAVAGAASTPEVCFLALNENVQELSVAPYFYGSAFVPYSVFGSFRIYSSFFSSSNTISLYRSDKQLYFNLTTGQAYDGDDNYYATSTVKKNGQVYVSVPFVCNFFGLNWSYIKGIGYGDILRITDSDSYLSDSEFIVAAASIMQPRYESYISSLTPSPSPSPSALPASPTPTAIHNTTPVYLSFEGVPSARLLDLLARYSANAAFYLTPEEIAASPDTVRRIYGSGHSIGVFCGADPAADFAAGSALLLDAVQIRTVLVSSSGDAMTACQNYAVQSQLRMGQITLDAADRFGYGVSSQNIISRIEAAQRSVHLRLDCSDNSVSALSRVLSYLSANQYDLRLEREV